MTLAVRSIGYLVPRGDFAGRVHSVFPRACNIEAAGALLTLASPEGDDGPATLRLARTTPIPADLLRLAAGGHHGRALLRARDALVADVLPDALAPAVGRALAIGATSGAAALLGLLHAAAAWSPAQPAPR